MDTDYYVNGIDCRSAESLYDSLLKEMVNNKNSEELSHKTSCGEASAAY